MGQELLITKIEGGLEKMKSIIFLYSYHNHNTEKVAKAIAPILDAEIKWPDDVNPEELQEYDLVGFGSGLYGGVFHKISHRTCR